MTWDWATDSFKTLIVAGITWIVVYLRKKAKPLYHTFKKYSNLVETTDQLKREISILQSRQLGMYDIVRDPLYVLNEKGEVIYANNAWAKMGGLHDPRDGYGYGYIEMLSDTERERMEKLGERLREHPSSWEGIVRFKQKGTDKIIVTECRTALVYDSDKKLVETLGRLYIIKEEPPQ